MSFYQGTKTLPKFMILNAQTERTAEPHTNVRTFLQSKKQAKPGIVLSTLLYKPEADPKNFSIAGYSISQKPNYQQQSEFISVEELYYYENLDLICGKQAQHHTTKKRNPFFYNKGLEKTMNFYGYFKES